MVFGQPRQEEDLLVSPYEWIDNDLDAKELLRSRIDLSSSLPDDAVLQRQFQSLSFHSNNR